MITLNKGRVGYTSPEKHQISIKEKMMRKFKMMANWGTVVFFLASILLELV